ncbi:MAG: hypothetical protein JNJ89_10235 [Rubrivivax sp.]|nr:hypothetical protein [Rubrivivax sp.]
MRNRLIVLVNWAWAYWTYQRHARIVLGSGGSDNRGGGSSERGSDARGDAAAPG